MAILLPLTIQEEHIETSRFRLSQMTAQRAKMLLRGSKPVVDTAFQKPITIALQEIYDGKVSFYSQGEADQIRQGLEERTKEQHEAEAKAIKEIERAKAKKKEQEDGK